MSRNAPPTRPGVLETMDLHGPQHVPDVQLDAPVLVLWKHATAEIVLRRSAGRQWRYRPRAGSVDLLAAGAYDSYRAGDGRRHKLVLMLGGGGGDDRDGLAALPSRIQFQDRGLERLMACLERHHCASEPFGALYSQALVASILDRLQPHGNAPESVQPLRPIVRRWLVELIEQHLAEPPSMDAMATLAGMGGSHFLRAFRASFGMPPHQYLMTTRVERARHLLLHAQGSLSELAAELGFASHAHFTTVFRARTGLTPSEYRRSSAPPAHGARGPLPRPCARM